MLPPTFNKWVTVPDWVPQLNDAPTLTVTPLVTFRVTAFVELGYVSTPDVPLPIVTLVTEGLVEFNPIVNEDIVGPVPSEIVQVGADV